MDVSSCLFFDRGSHFFICRAESSNWWNESTLAGPRDRSLLRLVDRAKGWLPSLSAVSRDCFVVCPSHLHFGYCFTLPHRCTAEVSQHVAAVRICWYGREDSGEWARRTIRLGIADR